MERRQLARTDVTISRMGLGTATWGATTDADDAATQLTRFVEAGGNLVDTADVYAAGRSEELLGRLLNRIVPRSTIVLATKSGAVPSGRSRPWVDASREHLIAALDASLRRLDTDYIDLWQVHAWDAGTPLDETLDAVEIALSSGRARCVGVCNYAGWQLAKAAAQGVRNGHDLLASTQNEYSLLERGIERELLPAARDAALGVLAWAPLGRGVLTGKYRGGVPATKQGSRFFRWYVRHHLDNERTPVIVKTVARVAERMNASLPAVALAWVRDRPGVAAAIVGARTADQLSDSLTAESLVLDDDAVRRLDEVSAPRLGYPERALARPKPRDAHEAVSRADP